MGSRMSYVGIVHFIRGNEIQLQNRQNSELLSFAVPIVIATFANLLQITIIAWNIDQFRVQTSVIDCLL